MVWPFGSSDGDSINQLSPELQDFLKKEASKPQAAPRFAPEAEPVDPATKLEIARPIAQVSIQDDEPPIVPPQSQYQDGRYAHLWKTYRPSSSSVAVSDGEILQNIARSAQWRKKYIENAATENCIFEALAEKDCWRKGSFKQQLWMCRAEMQALDRCMQLQTKFLHALGYLTSAEEPTQVDERIQMHADRLFQQMISHEKATKLAKDQGLPLPEFKPVMSRENLAKVLGVQGAAYMETAKQAETMAAKQDSSHVPEARRGDYEKAVQEMTPDERLVEEAVNVAYARDHSGLVKNYQQYVGQKKLEASQRRESGEMTIAERVRSLWGKE